MHIYGELLGSVDTNIYGVFIYWHSFTHGFPLKIQLWNYGFLICEGYLIMHNDLDIVCITEDSVYLIDLRCWLGSSFPKTFPWKPWIIMARKTILPGSNLFILNKLSNHLSLLFLVPDFGFFYCLTYWKSSHLTILTFLITIFSPISTSQHCLTIHWIVEKPVKGQ